MIYLIIFCLILTLVYNFYIISKFKKIPESLSETSYMLGGNKRFLFTLYCFSVCFLLIPVLLEFTPVSLQILPFIFCGGILFAGCSPLFKEGLDKIIHYTFAYLSFFTYICYMIFCMGWIWLIIYLTILSILCLIKWKCYVYWAEILALLETIIFILCCYI